MTEQQQSPGPQEGSGTAPTEGSSDPSPAPSYAADPEAQAFASAAAVMGERAPWRATVSPTVVIIEGVVLAVLGAALWLLPDLSSTLALQAIALILLVTAVLGAWRVLRDQIAPVRVGPVAFRAGVGCAVGVIVLIGSVIADDRETTTLAVAIILGIGLVLYGLSALVAALFRRESGSRFPVVALAISAAAIGVGALLVWRADQGIDELQAVFVWLGILLLVLGIAIVGWGIMLRQRDQEDAAE